MSDGGGSATPEAIYGGRTRGKDHVAVTPSPILVVGSTSVMHIQEVCTHATWLTSGLRVETDDGTSELKPWVK